MRNKLLNNNQPNYISKGGVLYRPGELPTLTKEQLAQANLVSKLPRDFPFANWEGMTTKQQLQQMKYSGLNSQDQWSLLNANVPLSVLNEHNQAQEYAAAQASPVQAPALLSAKAVQALAQNIQKAGSNPSISPSLQSGVPQRKLEEQKENLQTKLLGKPSIAAANPVKITNPTKTPYSYKPLEKGDGSGDTDGEDGKKESWFHALLDSIFAPKEKPKASPQIVPITMVEPRPTIPMTPTPKPTPKPTPTPTPTAVITQRQQLASDIVTYAEEHLGAKYSKTGNTGKNGYDCSGLVRAACKDKGSGLIFGQDHISYSCEDGMAKDMIEEDCCDIKYDLSKGGNIPNLERGDLVYFADSSDLSTDKHVAIATGNGLQVIEASDVVHKVTNEFDAYAKRDNGLYIRDSGQIVTYVLQPFYDWEEQP